MNPSPAVLIEDVHKSYGPALALDGLTVRIEEGEVFALLGPNGAGKTTAIEILEGYQRQDSGRALVLGLDPQRVSASLKQQVGVVLQEDGVYPGLTARELLRLYASYYHEHLDPDELLDRVGLEASTKTRCRRLSGGQKRRLALALALIGRPRLLFLDEPTTGMDPQARRLTWDIIHDLRRQGCTVLLTTHLMDEAERLADRVGIIDHGRLIALGEPAALTGRGESGMVRLAATPGLDVRSLSALPGGTAAREIEPGVYLIETTSPSDYLAGLTPWLRDRDITLRGIQVGDQSLEDVFLRLTGTELRS